VSTGPTWAATGIHMGEPEGQGRGREGWSELEFGGKQKPQPSVLNALGSWERDSYSIVLLIHELPACLPACLRKAVASANRCPAQDSPHWIPRITESNSAQGSLYDVPYHKPRPAATDFFQ